METRIERRPHYHHLQEYGDNRGRSLQLSFQRSAGLLFREAGLGQKFLSELSQKLPFIYFLQKSLYNSVRRDGRVRHKQEMQSVLQYYKPDRSPNLDFARAQNEQRVVYSGKKKPWSRIAGQVHAGIRWNKHKKIIFKRFCLSRPKVTQVVPQVVQNLRQRT